MEEQYYYYYMKEARQNGGIKNPEMRATTSAYKV
jgi:hypothetical protein